MGDQNISGHLLLLTIPAWGCLRPLCAFAAKAVQERDDVIVTYLTSCDFDKRVQAECRRYFLKPTEALENRLRFINIGGQGLTLSSRSQLLRVLANNFVDYYEKLARCEPVQCHFSGTTFPSVLAPTIAMTDSALPTVMQAVRAVTGRRVPVFLFAGGGAYLRLRVFGPEKYGGMGDRPGLIGKGNDQNSDEEKLQQVMNMDRGEVVQLPGLPPFYDHEWYPYPSEGGVLGTFYSIWKEGHEFAEQCDGFVYTSGEAFEAEAIYATRQWLKESGDRPLYAVGPILPPREVKQAALNPTSALGSPASDQSSQGSNFQEFMDKVLAQHGKNSLLYMSFGTVVWPRGGYIQVVVEVLLRLRIPFIFALASPDADLSNEFIDKATATGLAMFGKWCPQQAILSHPVTGWVLTHCGINTIFESLMYGIPMIAWPITFDEPANAALMSLSLDVAFELIQVRTGVHGLKPAYRCGGIKPTGTADGVAAELENVLNRMRGEEGERKRKAAEMVRERFRQGWEEGGAASKDFRRLLMYATADH